MNKRLLSASLFALMSATIVSCGPKATEATDVAVAKASTMTLKQLEKAAEEEAKSMGEGDKFQIVGLTSVLSKAATSFEKAYPWIEGKWSENHSYKDAQLIQALGTAKKQYVADYALVQDIRNIASFDGRLTHNYVPSDWKEMGLTEKDLVPLKGVAFNKLFWTNTNFTEATKSTKHPEGQTLHNIWQLAGSAEDEDHIDQVSFQSPLTEQINMSFLVSTLAPQNEARILDAYKKYYNKTSWESPTKTDKDGKVTALYDSIGKQWVTEFINNITAFHGSDGTAMKQTQLADAWNKPVVYFGAFAKMKDAVANYFDVTEIMTPAQQTAYGAKDVTITKDGKEKTIKNAVNAMDTVKWDWTIDGFNGFYYNMCSQVVNNAKYPYIACLFARNLLSKDAYEGAVYNGDLATHNGQTEKKVNQYGYYFPASNDITYAKGDWTRDQHVAKEIVEDYDFLGDLSVIAKVNEITALVGAHHV